MLKVTWPQSLAWRMERQLLDPLGTAPVEDVVRRLCGVQAQVASSAALAITVRQASPKPADVSRAIGEGRLVKTWAMRAALHLLTPEDAGAYLAVMAEGKWWHSTTWQRYFGVSPSQMEALRPIVREALAGRALTRDQLVTEVTSHRGYDHLGEVLRSGWGTILKPLAWQGDLVHGPSRGTKVTFMRPEEASDRWAGVPEIDVAWPKAILSYLAAYGPATIDNFSAWLSRGTISKPQLRSWFDALADRISVVEVDGAEMYVRSEDIDSLALARPSSTVRLLGGFDQWVLGPGTDDPHVVPPAHRRLVSKQSGWIAPVAVIGGVVAGTWEAKGGAVSIEWFPGMKRPPKKAIDAEVGRLSALLALGARG